MIAKCHKCGLESEAAESFAEMSSFRFSKKKVAYCPDCLPDAIQQRCALFYLSIVFIALVVTRSFIVMASIFLAFLFMVPLALVHELAHLLAARFVGYGLVSVTVNAGKKVFSRKIFGVRFTINAVPGGGFTQVLIPHSSWPRLRFFLMLSAGPAIHIVIMILILFLVSLELVSNSFSPGQVAPVAALSTVNLIMLIVGILPIRSMIANGEKVGTDGLQMITAPFLKQKRLQDLFMESLRENAILLADQGKRDEALSMAKQAVHLAPDDVNNANALGCIQLNRGDYRVARSIFQDLLAKEDLKPTMKFLLMNNLASVDVADVDQFLLQRADQNSAEAYANIPWMNVVKGTRGAVLAASGNSEKAIELLSKSSGSDDENKTALVWNLYWLAVAEHKRDNVAISQKYLQEAKELDEQNPLLPHFREHCKSLPAKAA